jgi:GNAT superfamily N-acetyltransferase
MTTAEYLIRDARLEEAAGVIAVWRRAFGHEMPAGEQSDIERVILDAHRSRLFIASASAGMAGTLIAAFDGWRGHLYRLAVLPEHRRSGIGAALVAEAERWLHSVGCHRLTALAEKDESAGIEFWQAAGYSHDEASLRFVRDL